jgi:hypothetical protein
MISIPYFFRLFKSSLDYISSDLGKIFSLLEITVTLDPSLENTEAISNPITPAPITVIVSGTFDKDKAPVDDMKIFSSIRNPFGHDISDPVAINIFSASIVFLPS